MLSAKISMEKRESKQLNYNLKVPGLHILCMKLFFSTLIKFYHCELKFEKAGIVISKHLFGIRYSVLLNKAALTAQHTSSTCGRYVEIECVGVMLHANAWLYLFFDLKTLANSHTTDY